MKPPPIQFRRMPGVTDYGQPDNRAARADQKLRSELMRLPGGKAWAREFQAGNPEAEALWIRAKKEKQRNTVQKGERGPMRYVPHKPCVQIKGVTY